MFSAAEDRNATVTWALRVTGVFMLFFGFILPLVTVTSALPWFLGPIGAAANGIGAMLALIAALGLGSVVIGVAWAAARPAVGIPVLAVGLCAAGGGVFYVRAKRRAPIPRAKSAAKDPEEGQDAVEEEAVLGALEKLRI